MNIRRLQKYVRSFEVSLGIVCVAYLALLAMTALVVNHAQGLGLDQHSIGRIWLPSSYAPDTGYEVPVSVIVRDLNAALLFSAAGARIMDTFAIFWLAVLMLEVAMRIAGKAPLEVAARGASSTSMRQPLSKAAPYGEMRRRMGCKVLEFKGRK